jgi:ParB family transcriptional regulator, chromosome partitioning protein
MRGCMISIQVYGYVGKTKRPRARAGRAYSRREAMLSAAAPAAGVLQASTDLIEVNPFQPRKIFSEEALADLAASIKSKGVLQPLLVKKNGSGYQLIAGERRLRAAIKAGLKSVPVIVKDADEQNVREIALIENLQREDLNVIEEAEAYQSLIGSYGYTQEALSEKVGKSRSAIANALRLLKLCPEIKEDLMAGKIDMGHARAYLGLDTRSAQEAVHREVLKKGLSVRQTEVLIKRLKETKEEKNKKKQILSPKKRSLPIYPASCRKILAQKSIFRAGVKRELFALNTVPMTILNVYMNCCEASPNVDINRR